MQRLLKEERMDVNTQDWDKLTPLIPAVKAIAEGGGDSIMALMEASIVEHV